MRKYRDPIDGDHRRVKSCPYLGETLYQIRMSVEFVLVNVDCRIRRFRWLRLALEEMQQIAVGQISSLIRQPFHSAPSNLRSEGGRQVRPSRAPFTYERLPVFFQVSSRL